MLSVKDVQQAHPATLAEVREKVLADYRRDKAVDLAKSKAEELGRRAKAGEDLAKAAKDLGFEVKTSDLFARNGSIPDVGSASQVIAAFTMSEGQTSDPLFLGSNWVIYRVAQHQQPDPNDLAKQSADIQSQLLEARRDMAFDAFRKSLDDAHETRGQTAHQCGQSETAGNPVQLVGVLNSTTLPAGNNTAILSICYG